MDIDLFAVVESAQRLPRRIAAADGIAETDLLQRQAGIDRRGGLGGLILTLQGKYLDCQVIQAVRDDDWRDKGYDDEPPWRSVTQAYADLLDLAPHEVGSLADVEAEPLDGSSGDMIYGYLLDFTDHASPEIAQKIVQRHGSLRIEVGPNFFDDVRDNDWPR
ncbi:putative uncharacterized protein [Bordetella bronchiseptica MO211]|nr:putative uncharacterized protein [Bordetella bronchiseptica MO211]